jgi:hypothetical protein
MNSQVLFFFFRIRAVERRRRRCPCESCRQCCSRCVRLGEPDESRVLYQKIKALPKKAPLCGQKLYEGHPRLAIVRSVPVERLGGMHVDYRSLCTNHRSLCTNNRSLCTNCAKQLRTFACSTLAHQLKRKEDSFCMLSAACTKHARGPQ